MLIVGILLLEFPILGLRWHLLISPLVRTHTWNTLNHYFLGIFLNNFTPAQLGGDVYRYYVVKTEVLKRQEIVAALIQERLIGLVGFLLFFVLCLWGHIWLDLASGEYPSSSISLMGVGSVCIILIYIFASRIMMISDKISFLRKIPGFKIARATMGSAFEWDDGLHFTFVLALSVAGGAIVWTMAVQAVAWQLGVEASIFVLGMTAIGADLIRIAPISIQGIGVREFSFAFFFALFGLSPEDGFVIGLVSYIALSLAMILIGIVGKLLLLRVREEG